MDDVEALSKLKYANAFGRQASYVPEASGLMYVCMSNLATCRRFLASALLAWWRDCSLS